MFSSNRKYSPLPTTSSGPNQRKRAGGGLSTWKRFALIGFGITAVLFIGYSSIPKRGNSVYVEDEYGYSQETMETYTPEIDSKPHTDIDETDYSTPPFRPPTGALGEEEEEEEEEEDNIISIKPIGDINEHVHQNQDEDDDYLEYPSSTTKTTSGSNPHDAFGDDTKGAVEADPDFSTIDNEDDEESERPNGLPSSFEDDENPENTSSCMRPYSTTKPLVQYASVIDAGSTGSRIHVYKFNNCGPSPALEYETFKMLNPGLSSYANDPEGAAESLNPLLKEAERVIPKSLWSCSPIEVKATAGLRLLGHTQSEAILDQVKYHIETNYKFVIGGENSVMVMDGKDEGVYAWITANYLLNKIGEGATSTDTLAVMDLGGASTQIVFEPKFAAKSGQQLLDGEHKYSLNFGGKEFTLYQHSYLGYGLMRARRSIHNLIAFTWSFGKGEIDWDEMDEDIRVPNPCLTKGSTRRVELDPPGRKAVNVTMNGGNGGFEACNRFVELVMAKDAICEVKPCSFDGVYQPSLLDTFPKGQLLALSYFTDRIKPLLKSTHTKVLISDLTQLAKDVCDGPTSWKKKFAGNSVALAELEDRPEYCLDLTFMNALLGLGYELSPQRELVVEKKLNGVELGWALGAGLALVQNAKLTCTA